MSRFSGRLQVATGSSGQGTGFGTPLPQGGFQSIDITYSAEERCRVLPRVIVNEFGDGAQDVVDNENAVEDEPVEDPLLASTEDADAQDSKKPKSNNAKDDGRNSAPKTTVNNLQLDDDFDKE